MRTCLVTGASGFLGRYVVRGLAASGYGITTLGPNPVEGYRNVTADLLTENWDLAGGTFDDVFHIAGLAHRVPRSEQEKQLFFDTNVAGTCRLLSALESCARLPDRILFVSTVSVYGVEEGTGITEEHPCSPADTYGSSKLEAERRIQAWGQGTGVQVTIARLPLVAGRAAPGNLGSMARAIQSGRYLGVGDGSARRSMVLAEDVARVFPSLAEMGGTFHLTDGQHPSFRELEAALAAALAKKPPCRLPLGAARKLAAVGDLLGQALHTSMPFSSRAFRKMTSTLTFSDARARALADWKPASVLDHASEICL